MPHRFELKCLSVVDITGAAGKLEDILVIPGMLRNMKAVKPCGMFCSCDLDLSIDQIIRG